MAEIIRQQVQLGIEIFDKIRPLIDRGQVHNLTDRMSRIDRLDKLDKTRHTDQRSDFYQVIC